MCVSWYIDLLIIFEGFKYTESACEEYFRHVASLSIPEREKIRSYAENPVHADELRKLHEFDIKASFFFVSYVS